MRERITKLLEARYGLCVRTLEEVPAGWSAMALRAQTDRGDLFVKVYDRNRPSTRVWIERLDAWLPVAQWLGENTPLAAHMSVAIRAEDGAVRVDDRELILLVYPFIRGETLREARLTREQARALGRIVGTLHACPVKLPFPAERLTETYEFPFCTAMRAQLGDDSARALVAPHAALLGERIDELEARAAQLKKDRPESVLCHTDIHGWNLMQAENLILVDWEGLLLAPPEADLFSFTEAFFFGYAWDDILLGYREVRPGFVLHEDILKTYRLRRRLEDIDAFLESILSDNLAPDALAQSTALLTRECGLLRAT